VVVLCI
jgi:hypothetical protein